MIRELINSDYNMFLKLINKFRTTYFTKEQFINLLNTLKTQNNIIYVYEVDNIIIGTVKLIIETKFIFNISYVGHIEDIFIDEKYRNMNIGKKLVDHSVNIAKKKKCYKIICVCLDDVKNFYLKCGFELRGNFMSKLIKL